MLKTKAHNNLTEKQWLELRANNINSTESAGLFGASPYCTELELFVNKRDKIEVFPFQENERTEIGKELEPGIAAIVARKINCSVAPFKNYICDETLRIGSSFDFEITSGELKGWLLEIKNVDFLVHKNQWLDDEAPPHIEIQAQHQMLVADRPGCVIAALVGGNSLKMIHRTRNENIGELIKNKVGAFWRSVESNTPPPSDYSKDYDLIMYLNADTTDKIYDATDNEHLIDLIKQYKEASTIKTKKEKEAEKIKAEIIDIVGEVSKVLAPGISLNCTMTKANEGKLITSEMVGERIGARKSFRQFRVSVK